MAERPILFSAPMVRAILAGTKTQTRRVVHNPHRNDGGFVLQDYGSGWWPYRSHDGESGHYLDRQKDGDYYSEAPLRCPYGQPGDRLWVRETFQRFTDDGEILYKADPAALEAMNELKRDECLEARWRPSIHMPRWASRITLEVTGVRVERLQDISEADAWAEGCAPAWLDADDNETVHAHAQPTYRQGFARLWREINGPGSWEANPWVWVVEFRRVEVPA